ncbi:SMP-30/gluconolactonase/LRE family protein [Pelagibacteraceae bacterium]|nr:SMP-30/gluconolactonase/LRE family protein [Pelagibacteraceae bacterium]
MSKVELYKDVKNSLGEGITWSSINQSLFWLDIKPETLLFRINLQSEKLETFELPEFVTASSIISKSEIALVSNNGVNKFNFQTKKYEKIKEVEENILTNRSNDGASDAKGRLWFGTMQNNINNDGSSKTLNTKSGTLYCLLENKLNIVETNLGIPNTFVWSPDNTKFYFADSIEGSLLEYKFNLDEGSLSDKKFFFDFDRGAPDGSTIDSDGFIWNCRWGGSCVVKIDPKGRVDQIYELPVENVTNCVFGGSDLKTLFITTANNSGKNKYDGSLFALNVNTPGIEDNKFKI